VRRRSAMMHLAPWEAARRVKARLMPADVWLGFGLGDGPSVVEELGMRGGVGWGERVKGKGLTLQVC